MSTVKSCRADCWTHNTRNISYSLLYVFFYNYYFYMFHRYVLDINEEVFVWAGNESSGSHKFVAMQKAEELLGKTARLRGVSILT